MSSCSASTAGAAKQATQGLARHTMGAQIASRAIQIIFTRDKFD